jgi:hypothetical protein
MIWPISRERSNLGVLFHPCKQLKDLALSGCELFAKLFEYIMNKWQVIRTENENRGNNG